MPVKRLLVLSLLVLVASSAFAGNHILRYNSLPSSFEASVAAAGGSVLSRHDGAGIAVVSASATPRPPRSKAWWKR